MTQQIIQTDAVLSPKLLKTIENLQADKNEDIVETCKECEIIARWFRSNYAYFSSEVITMEKIFNFNSTLDHVRDILEDFTMLQEGGEL